MRINRIILLSFIIFSCCFTSSASEINERFPIVAVAKDGRYSYMDSTLMSHLRSAGFNVAQSIINVTSKVSRPQGDTIYPDNPFINFDLSVENANREGMQIIGRLWDPSPKTEAEADPSDPQWKGWYSLWSNLTKRMADNPTIHSWQVSDEPLASKFKMLKAAGDTVRAHDHLNRPVLINLPPYIPDAPRLAGVLTGNPIKEYKDYVNLFDKELDPDIWSYDAYAVKRFDDRRILNTDIFRNFEYFSHRARKDNKPFWAYVMAMEATRPKTPTHPHATGYWTPDTISMGLEARAALAYGAQGLVYWAMTLRPDATNSEGQVIEAFPIAPLDLEGQPTYLLDEVRKINSDIRDHEKIFLGGKVKATVLTKNPEPQKKLGLSILKKNRSFGPIKKISEDGKGLLLSQIENNGKKYLVIVSYDIFGPQKVNITFKRPMIKDDSFDNPLLKWSGEIGAGDWIIFEEISPAH